MTYIYVFNSKNLLLLIVYAIFEIILVAVFLLKMKLIFSYK
ncbi:protein of unknown function [Clostridium beijerinckii]|nr:protein of unknown function [Clostridium beijerinckii]